MCKSLSIKIVSLILAFSILFSGVAHASIIDAFQYGVYTFDQFLSNAVMGIKDSGYYAEGTVGWSLIDWWNALVHGDTSFKDEYSNYVTTLDRTTANSGVSVTGYSCTSASSKSYGGYYGLCALFDNNTPNTMQALYHLGVNQNVLITACADSYLIGYFFDEEGVFTHGLFVNPFDQAHASYLGVYAVSSLELYLSGPVRWTRGSKSYSFRVYYNKAYAEAQPDFITSDAYAMCWDQNLILETNSNRYLYFYVKSSVNSVWSSGSSGYSVYSVNDGGGSYTGYYPTGGIVWDSSRIVVAPTGTDSSSRTASLMQTINNYNSVDNSVNYYIGTLNVDGAVEDTYDPALYDEETLAFTEPVTGAQYQTSGWVYDYNTRSYDLDLESGTFLIGENDITRILLTYGDDDVTIDYYAGDALVTTDTYAYVIAEQVDQSTCAHEYGSEITDPTCSDYGKAVYTCTRCGHTYTETIPALGHDWLATEVTATAYALPDGTSCPSCAGTAFTHTRNGDIYTCTCSDCGTEWSVNAVITYGSTTYTCSRCGESYVEQDGKGLSEGLGDAIKSFAKKAWSAIASGIGKLFSGFADLLGGIFGFFTETVAGGIKNFFSTLSDDSILGYYQDDTGTATLPEGLTSAMSMIPAFFGGLPAELQAPVIFGIAALFLIAALKLFL